MCLHMRSVRSVRGFHAHCASRSAVSKLSLRKSSVPNDIVSSAQGLRLALNSKDGGSIEHELRRLLTAVTSAPPGSELPAHLFKLMFSSLNTSDLRPDKTDLQLLFRAALLSPSSSSQPDADLVFKLCAELSRNIKLSPSERLEYGRLCYRLLRKNGFIAESNKLIVELFRSNAQFGISNEYVESLILAAEEYGPDPAGVLQIVLQWPTTRPGFEALKLAIERLAKSDAVAELDALANFLYFTNAHYKVPEETAVMLLDAFLPFAAAPRSGPGRSKVVKHCLSRWASPKPGSNTLTSLENLELLLMACVEFQESRLNANLVAELIEKQFPMVQYSKETWDVLAQWSIYTAARGTSEGPLERLKTTVLQRYPREFLDSTTLHAVLVAAEKAQCSEQQIQGIISWFETELGVSADAAVYDILIRRALRAVNVQRAADIFNQSQCDWNLNDNRHLAVLSDLLIEMCRTKSIDRQEILNTYQKVRVFTAKLSYRAQVIMVQTLLQESRDHSVTPVGIFIAEQFGDSPDLAYEPHKELFEVIFDQLAVTTDEELASELCVLLNSTIVLPYEAYYPICAKMCSLDRVDVAHLFFRQMRNRAKAGLLQHPGEEIYMMLFAQYANKSYELGVHELDTYFRLDVHNEMTVPILNRIMAGYASLQDSHKMGNLWTEVISLPRGTVHGPNTETMRIWMHYIAQQMPIEAVDDVWESLGTDFKIKPDAGLLKEYVIANCYHGYYSRALEMIKIAPEQYQIDISPDILEAVYNWTLLPNRKDEVREFALEKYPSAWKELEDSGTLKNVLLPAQNAWGDTDEQSRRWEAIKELQAGHQLVIEDS